VCRGQKSIPGTFCHSPPILLESGSLFLSLSLAFSQKAGSQADRREGRIKGKEGSVVRTNMGIKVGVLALK